jgi:hypothetical protein
MSHSTNSNRLGTPFERSGAIRFFTMQPLGLMVEDIIVKGYSILFHRRKNGPGRRAKFLGYLWVLIWMSWTSPSYLYPMLDQTDTGTGGSVVPVSLVSLARSAIL